MGTIGASESQMESKNGQYGANKRPTCHLSGSLPWAGPALEWLATVPGAFRPFLTEVRCRLNMRDPDCKQTLQLDYLGA